MAGFDFDDIPEDMEEQPMGVPEDVAAVIRRASVAAAEFTELEHQWRRAAELVAASQAQLKVDKETLAAKQIVAKANVFARQNHSLQNAVKKRQAALIEAEAAVELAQQAEASRAKVLPRPREAAEQARQECAKIVDEAVLEKLMSAAPSDLPDLPKIPWLPFGSEAAGAVVRLFVFFGPSKPASQYQPWVQVGTAISEAVRVCPVELPGKGEFKGATRGDVHVLAEAFIRDVLGPLQSDGRPFALLGFSVGARVAYEIARRVPPLRLYVAGRAAPHIMSPGQPPEAKAVPSIPQAKLNDPAALSLRKFDLSLGTTPLRAEDTMGRPLLTRVSCRLRVHESTLDASWPPSVIGDSWDQYSPVPEALQKTTYTNLTHDELCSSAGKPLLEDVLADLLNLVKAHPLA